MTVQQLLLLEAEVILPIGSNKLQQLIRTMRDFKQTAEKFSKKNAKLEQELLQSKLEILELKQNIIDLNNIRMKFKGSIDLDISDL